MKEKSPVILFAIAIAAFLMASPQSRAEDCFKVADEVKAVTIKKGKPVNLRKTPEVGEGNIAGSATAGTKLDLLDRQPKTDGQYCWYAVRSTKGETLWIADRNLEPPLPASSANQPTIEANNTGEALLQVGDRKPPQNSKREFAAILPDLLSWIFRLGIVGGLALGAWAFNSLRDELDRLKNQVGTLQQRNEELGKRSEAIGGIGSQSSANQNEIFKLSQTFDSLQEQHGKLEAELREIRKKYVKEQPSLPPAPSPPPMAARKDDLFSPFLSKELEELIAHFNDRDADYFRDSRFNSLKLSQDTIRGNVGLDGRRVIRLEPAPDKAQAYYLEVALDSANWLIPNASSLYFQHILNDLSENPEIFTVCSGFGKGSPELKRPAKLRSIGSGNWEISEPGEFKV